MERERLKSRLGFILLSAGCAIGIGNVWKFPYMVGENGGGAFVLLYLFFLVILGVPVLTMEFSMGRASQKSIVKLYQELEPKGSKWHLHGKFALLGNYLIMMFYSVVAGWMLHYFVTTASGGFNGASAIEVTSIYSNMLANPMILIGYMVLVVILGFVICGLGVKNGIEKVTKVMMLALLGLIIVLALNSIFLDGGSEGLKFYLLPSLEKMSEIGFINVIVSAMNQAFFTLSLGVGSMAIFGSYIDKERTLLGESLNVALLDTFVALCSGLIIFPACFAYGVQPDSGPSLIFVTLPNIFNHLPLGQLWGSLFFIFMTFAAFSTVIGVFETIISCTMDLFDWNRKKACLINCIIIILLSLPCALGFNLLKDIQLFGLDIMGIEDFLVSQILLPLGSLVFVLFCTTRYGWGWNHFMNEANLGIGLKIKPWMRKYMTYVIPILILCIFVLGIL